MKLLRVVMGLPGLLCLTACAWVPDSGQFSYDRGVIPEETRARFVPGSSTRTDVISLLGAPAWVSPDEGRLVYRVRYVNSYFWIYLVGGLAVGCFCDVRSHLFQFDPSGDLLEYRLVVESEHHGGDGGPSPLFISDQGSGLDYAALFDAGR